MSALLGEQATTSADATQLEESCRHFAFADIQSATNNFDEALVVGTGGFGKVYKGLIDGGATTVAIKRLDAKSNQGADEFWTEVKMLSKLRHPHLVALIGYCSDCNEMILVYEYMSRGTLADHLYKTSRKGSGGDVSHLAWEQRLNICIGAAYGLDYLHTDTDQSSIHRDVKTANILLDEDWVAKIADFGLSKIIDSRSITHVSTDVKGTFGYLDPDYFSTGRLTQKSDVYAFGVVLLEVLCGRPAVDARLEDEQISLPSWAQRCIKKGKLNKIIDPSLSGEILPQCLEYFAGVANNCLRSRPKERPSMADVLGRLELALVSQQRGIRPEGIINKMFQGIAGANIWTSEKNIPNSLSDVYRQYRNFSLDEIQVAGRLRWSAKVYKGSIDSGTLVVAIRRLRGPPLQNQEKILAEAKVQFLLPNIHIVSMIGVCYQKHELVLVHEYMDNGSLHDHLYRGNQIPWKTRLQICIDVAQGLQRLHEGTKHLVIHNNIDSSKILLDNKWVAKIADFTQAKIERKSKTALESFDYLWAAAKPDVYSFGVLLLEVLCSVKLVQDPTDEDYKLLLVRLFKSNIERGTIDQVIEPYLIGKIAPGCMREFIEIVWRCVLDQGIIQPLSMGNAVRSLQSALQLQEHWEKCGPDELHPNCYNYVVDNLLTSLKYRSLHDHLYRGNQIPWKTRLQICIDVAQGLQRLHEGTKHLRKSKTVLESFDYLWAAEPDEYSFGVLLLEVLCSMKLVQDPTDEDYKLLLVRLFKSNIERGTIDQVIEPYLIGKIAPGCMREFLEIVWRCVLDQGTIQPLSMDDAARSLQSALQLQEHWEKCGPDELHPNCYNYIVDNLLTSLKYRSLHDHLYRGNQIPWKTRLQICIDVAQGLQRLHEGTKHLRKSKTVLESFDYLWVAEPDEYSFGVLLLEVLCSMKLVQDPTDEDYKLLLVRLFKSNIERGTIDQVIEPYLIGKIAPGCMREFIGIVWRCVLDQGIIQPLSMGDAVRSLQSALQLQEHWEKCGPDELHPNCYNYVGDNLLISLKYQSLHDRLYRGNQIPWKTRLQICIDVAQRLQRLHDEGTKHLVIHNNIDSPKILLDNTLVAIIPDFTLAKIESQWRAAPELFNYLWAANVRSFGVLLLEVLCSMKLVQDPTDEDNKLLLVRSFKSNIERGTIDQFIEPYLIGKIEPQCLREFIEIAWRCVFDQDIIEPLSMDDAVRSLKSALQLQVHWERFVPDRLHPYGYNHVVDNLLISLKYRSLHDRLYRGNQIPWKTRLQICIDVAQRLQRLHDEGTKHLVIVPNNLNSRKFLLDNKLVAIIPGFTLAERDSKRRTWPELFNYLWQANVRSFGVLLLKVLRSVELVKDPADGNYKKSSLFRLFKSFIDRRTIDRFIEPYLWGQIAPRCMREFFMIAWLCLFGEDIIQLLSTGDVVGSLQSALQLQEHWECGRQDGLHRYCYGVVVDEALTSLNYQTSVTRATRG